MQTRFGRVMLTLLLAALLIAAFLLWNIEQRVDRLFGAEHTAAATLERLSATIADIGTVQQSYVVPGQLDEPWFERMSELVAQLDRETRAIGALLRSPGAHDRLKIVSDSIAALVAADGRVRQNVTLGQDLMAADVIFSDGRNILDTMAAQVRDLQGRERDAYRAEFRALARERWLVLSPMAALLVWIAGTFIRTGRSRGSTPDASVRTVVPAAGDQVLDDRSPAAATFGRISIDLASAAALCTDLARVSDSAALIELFGRAARILDASGIVLWMGAGDHLFAVVGHGYPQEAIGRFGSIQRNADNAAAQAWRSERPICVPGHQSERAAIVTPLFSPNGCIGVLALEVPPGREDDEGVQAAATIVAAQLAAIVEGWPTATVETSSRVDSEAQSA